MFVMYTVTVTKYMFSDTIIKSLCMQLNMFHRYRKCYTVVGAARAA